jgi:hypothetical protein
LKIVLEKLKMMLYLHPHCNKGALAQMVEQWTENPCVPGSIPGGTTTKKPVSNFEMGFCFFLYKKVKFYGFILIKYKFQKL